MDLSGVLLRVWISPARSPPVRTFRRAAAAVLGEIAEQRVHGVEARGVDHRAALAAHGDKAGLPQPVEMKRQRVGRRARAVPRPRRPACPRGPACTSSRKASSRLSCASAASAAMASDLFHISTNIEILAEVNSRGGFDCPGAYPPRPSRNCCGVVPVCLRKKRREVGRVGEAEIVGNLVDRLAGEHQLALGLGQDALADQVAGGDAARRA